MSKFTSFYEVSDLSDPQVSQLFDNALFFRDNNKSTKQDLKFKVGLLFFEPSTRTRISFELACINNNFSSVLFESGSKTSIAKGETFLDTLMTLDAMDFDLFVLRAPGTTLFSEYTKILNTPIINAGWGNQRHPTQALADALTIKEHFGQIKNKNILIVGDLKHSRVARSDIKVLSRLGANIGIMSSSAFNLNEDEVLGLLTSDKSQSYDFFEFSNHAKALAWADVVILLRYQKERFNEVDNSVDQEKFCLNQKTIKSLSQDGIVLHPGPFNRNVEISEDILNDPRLKIYNQVNWGVHLRSALLKSYYKNIISKGE